MNPYLEVLENNRKALLEITAGLSNEQYNAVPPGHNNNIIWNMAHNLVVSESMLYRNTNLASPGHPFDASLFKRGTRPTGTVSGEDILSIKEALLQTGALFEKAIGFEGLPENEIKVIGYPVPEDKLQFLLFHENMHYQAIGALLRKV
jgi:hypothetical protein